jgi:hypothetical protein
MKRGFGLLLLLGGDPFDAGVRAYRDGRFADAVVAFQAAEAAAGDAAPPELQFDLALAALRAGNLGLAEAAAERAAARGGARFAARREFLLGNVAFARCELAAAQAGGPEAEPFAFDAAIAFAERALRCWATAAADAAGWPAAERNAERALRRIASLHDRKRAAAERRPERLADPRLRAGTAPQPEPPAPEDPGRLRRDPSVALSGAGALPAERLLEQLARKEQQKQALRRELRRRSGATLERDW